MRAREARKLYKNDEVRIKETGEVECVSYIEDHGDDVYIFTCEGSDYHHTAVE